MPKLTIVIGANGAGKSTWCDQHRARRLPADFYNADSIAQGLGSWNSPRKQRTAREVVDHNIERHLAERSDFGFESTYSGSSRPDIVRRAKQAGSSSMIEAISSWDRFRPEIGRQFAWRWELRHTNGPRRAKKEIHRRWKAAQDNLATTAEHIDLIELLDNSGETRRSAVRIKNGRITDRGSRVPKWAAELATRATKQQIRKHQKDKVQKEKLEPPERRHPYTPAVIPHHPSAKLHPLSRVHPSADIGARTIIEAGAQVQRNAKIDKPRHDRSTKRAGCENARSEATTHPELVRDDDREAALRTGSRQERRSSATRRQDCHWPNTSVTVTNRHEPSVRMRRSRHQQTRQHESDTDDNGPRGNSSSDHTPTPTHGTSSRRQRHHRATKSGSETECTTGSPRPASMTGAVIGARVHRLRRLEGRTQRRGA